MTYVCYRLGNTPADNSCTCMAHGSHIAHAERRLQSCLKTCHSIPSYFLPSVGTKHIGSCHTEQVNSSLQSIHYTVNQTTPKRGTRVLEHLTSTSTVRYTHHPQTPAPAVPPPSALTSIGATGPGLSLPSAARLLWLPRLRLSRLRLPPVRLLCLGLFEQVPQ